MRLCRKLAWSPMLAVNLGTGTSEEACDWLEYCNAPAGTRWADLRVANGLQEPHLVRLWCLGNEMDGPWQLGHAPAREYAVKAQQTAKMMRNLDPEIKLVLCGSSGHDLPWFPAWDREVLEYCWQKDTAIDYLSLHRYVGNLNGDTADFLAVSKSIDRQIEQADAVCHYVRAATRSRKRSFLAFDEWGVWYKSRGKYPRRKFLEREGPVPPLNEEVYNLEDALVVAEFLHCFLRRADCVRVANLAQVVNVIAPILTIGDNLLLQSTYYPFALVARRSQPRTRGEKVIALAVALEGPGYRSTSYGFARYVDASAVLRLGGPQGDELSVFAVNRSLSQQHELRIELAGRRIVRVLSAERVRDMHAAEAKVPDPKAANSLQDPRRVAAEELNR
eukprot:gnl/TRDRNA2_/TRDRNA2_159085_c1_seq1.p1 gnl/TRDRNA2_/TRDRNA2_159085_c1~~gnl/TRDRNA2_/TRDRNA2_159085_c1_seq1.p1  ORF type:complete len:390 (-),score=59.66 gnl/TRDRNA2_/TRDRNA2_159085_c1_seq1:259-1428(-)